MIEWMLLLFTIIELLLLLMAQNIFSAFFSENEASG